jgi:hypothetical protein
MTACSARLAFLFAALLAAAASGCGDDETGSSGSESGGADPKNPDDAAELCVKLINDYRATESLPPYERWVDQEECSAAEAKSDSETGKAHGAFGQCGESAQNECPGWMGEPKSMIGGCLDLMWAEGPGADFGKHGHYINMSSKDYKQVACGFYLMANGSTWAVQNFK